MNYQSGKIKEHSTTKLVSGFSDLGVSDKILESLSRINCVTPTPIQRQAIPIALTGKDVVGIAQTGTGKTFAFGIPIIQRITQNGGQALIVLPTRELALQVAESLEQLAGDINFNVSVLIGGAPMMSQIRSLARNPRVIVATSGRLLDHLRQRTLELSKVNIVVLDEADRMLDMGFEPHIRTIFSTIKKERQTMLFSATMPGGIMKIAEAYMAMPVRVEVTPPGITVDLVTQEIFIVHKDSKNRLLDKLLAEYTGSALIFTRTKHGAKRLAHKVRSMGHRAAEIHSNRTLSQRREALDGFKAGKYRVLVATDIASRGIDVVGIALVINYDVPNDPEDYVHRIGRTARAGQAGHAITFAMPEQRGELRRIERLVRKNLPISALPELPAERPFVPEPDYKNAGPRRPFRHGAKSRRSEGARPSKFSKFSRGRGGRRF